MIAVSVLLVAVVLSLSLEIVLVSQHADSHADVLVLEVAFRDADELGGDDAALEILRPGHRRLIGHREHPARRIAGLFKKSARGTSKTGSVWLICSSLG